MELHITPPVQIEPPVEVSDVNILVHKPVQKRVALLWTIEEETILAHKEATLTIDGKTSTEITQILSEGSLRSKESIQKRRTIAEFKQLVQSKIQELTQPNLEVINEEPEMEKQDTPTPSS